MESSHVETTRQMLLSSKNNNQIKIDGHNLTVSQVFSTSRYPGKCMVIADDAAMQDVRKNHAFLKNKLKDGLVLYGVNTGFGGSADVRCSDVVALQQSMVRFLNVGFGEIFDPDLPRGVMLIRANSLIRAMSGVRPDVIQLILDMINHDIVPHVPKRGSISASGDLMPISYIAAAMMGRHDCKVWYQNRITTAPKALQEAGIAPITFHCKEALAVVNSCSCSASLSACVVYEANVALLLTQVATALSVEALTGRLESFHPIIHRCMPHRGQLEVAENILALLNGTSMAKTQLEIYTADNKYELKQDMYALRTAAQWLGPAVEILKTAADRIRIEVNSSNDNPLVDHHNDQMLHGGNFQGASIAVSMDQTRQALQLCGKLIFAQMSEIVNVKLSNGLPPNLAGSDISIDFGFKGMDIAMAAYQSELDWMTSPVTNHVLSAELNNQSVNSLALISARKTSEAIEILQMMLANMFVSLSQAIDLRYLKRNVEFCLNELFVMFHVDRRIIHPELWPWYHFAFKPKMTAKRVAETLQNDMDKDAFIKRVVEDVNCVTNELYNNQHVKTVIESLGTGTRKMYSFIRKDVGIAFCDGKRAMDADLQRLLMTIKSQCIDDIILDIFNNDTNCDA